MLPILIWLMLAFTLVLFLIRWMVRRSVNIVQDRIEAKIRWAETVANHGTLPDAWLQPYRRRLAAAVRRDAGDDGVAKIVRNAQQHCLRQIAALERYFQQGAFVDSPATRDILVDALRAERTRWAALSWQEFLTSSGLLADLRADRFVLENRN